MYVQGTCVLGNSTQRTIPIENLGFINIIPDGDIGFHKQLELVYKWVCRIGVEALHGRNGVMPGRPQGTQIWS